MESHLINSEVQEPPPATLVGAKGPVGPLSQGQPGGRLGWSLAGNLVGLLASTATALLTSRVVTPFEYGRYSVVVATWGLLTTTVTWCGSLTMRFGVEELQTRGSIARTASTRLVFAVPALGVILPGTLAWLWIVRSWSPGMIALTVASVAVALGYDISWWSALAAQLFRRLTLTNLILKGVALPVLLAALALGFTIRAPHLLTASIFGTAVSCALLFRSLPGLVRPERPELELLKKMWKYARPGLWGVPAVAAIAWADPLLMAGRVSNEEIGRYQLAAAALVVSAAVGGSFNSVFSGELLRARARGATNAANSYARDWQPTLAIGLGLGAIGLSCFVPYLVGAVVGPQFKEAGDAAAVLTIAGGFLAASFSLQPLVAATDRTRLQQGANVIQALVNVCLDLAWVGTYGAIGIAWANVAAWSTHYLVLGLGLRAALPVSLIPVFVLYLATAVVGTLARETHSALPSILVGALCIGLSLLLLMKVLRQHKSHNDTIV